MKPSHFLFFAVFVAACGGSVVAVGTPAQAAAVLFVLLLVVLTITWLLLAFSNATNPLDVDSELPDQVSEGEQRSYYLGGAPKKHPQHILAMDQQFFEDTIHFNRDLNILSAESFLDWPATAAALTIREREALEPDEGYRQVLPYIVVRQLGRDGVLRYLAYRRTKRVGEQRLAGMASIGFGGHIDAVEVVINHDSTIDLRTTILDCARRELNEELAFQGYERNTRYSWWSDNINPSFAHLFITHNEGVQRMHLGVVLYLDLPADVVPVCAEEELETLGMYSVEELADWIVGQGSPTLEVWSRLLVEHFLGMPKLDEPVMHCPV